MVAVSGPLFTDCDLGCVLPNTVCLIRKLILSNGLFGWVARMAICLCTEMDDNWGFGRFHSSGKLHPLPSALSVGILLSCSSLLFLPSIVPLHHIVCSLIFIWCYFHSFFFSFCFCLPRPLRCQRFTLDIQLLAGHRIVISFRAAPFRAGPQTVIQITSSTAFRVAALQNVVFKQFWGHHLIWSHKHNWMSVVT